MNVATKFWPDRPIRVCPTVWCKCPHREPGDDPRCAECRARPADAERHGPTLTKLHGDAWNGECGCSYGTWLRTEDCPAARADQDTAERVASMLNREELEGWLLSLGVFIAKATPLRELRMVAASKQVALWWPRMFV